MKIVFISNYLNHYMLPIVEELINLGCETWFVETDMLPDNLRKGGFNEYDEIGYYVKAWKNDEAKSLMEELALDADVLIIGNKPKMLEWKRLRQGKLTFEMSERPLKKGIINAVSPVILKNQLLYHLFFYNKPVYMLCFSAYTANDEYRMRAFRDRCYQFGYFPRISELDIESVLNTKPKGKTRIIWCARFIKWKHPELAVLLAERLKRDGYNFELNMIGSGVLYDKIKIMILDKNLSDCVNLLGNYPNPEVLHIMSQHHIFLFTSDKNEGWGVVLNEAMGQGCCPVASHMIGASPCLLRHKNNGMVFKSGNINSAVDCVKYLLDNPSELFHMSKRAYETVSGEWSPLFVARRLYTLFEILLSGKKGFSFNNGPLSKAFPISEEYKF